MEDIKTQAEKDAEKLHNWLKDLREKYEQEMHHYLTHLSGYRYAYIKTCCEEILSHCDDEMIEYLKSKPDASSLHFSLGLWIRNHYIYNHLIFTGRSYNADDKSNEIIHWLIYYLNNELKVDENYNEEEYMKEHPNLIPVNEHVENLKKDFAENPTFQGE